MISWSELPAVCFYGFVPRYVASLFQIVGTPAFLSHSTGIRKLRTGQYLACVVGDAKGEGGAEALENQFYSLSERAENSYW